jgi:hypothetical protein
MVETPYKMEYLDNINNLSADPNITPAKDNYFGTSGYLS